MDIAILFILMGALYVFMVLPQQRKMKAQRVLLSSVKEGDVVITNSGIYGAVAEVEGDVVWLEVAPEVELKIQKGAIAEIVADDADDADETDDDADDADEAMIDADDGADA